MKKVAAKDTPNTCKCQVPVVPTLSLHIRFRPTLHRQITLQNDKGRKTTFYTENRSFVIELAKLSAI